jgi:hypothetical protein
MLAMWLHVNHNIVQDPPPPSSAIIKITKSRMGTRHMSGVRQLQVVATMHALNQALIPVMSKACPQAERPRMLMQAHWVPEPVLEHVLPEMVAEYYNSGTSHKQAQQCKQGREVGERTPQGAIMQRASASGLEVIDLTSD